MGGRSRSEVNRAGTKNKESHLPVDEGEVDGSCNVGGGEDEHVRLGLEAVQLGQEGVHHPGRRNGHNGRARCDRLSVGWTISPDLMASLGSEPEAFLAAVRDSTSSIKTQTRDLQQI